MFPQFAYHTLLRRNEVMDVLPQHFRILRFFGIWHESEKQHRLVKYIWQPFNVNVLVFFALSQLGALSIYRDNVNDFTECLFLSLTYVGLCFKLINWLCRRDTMIGLLDEFRARICQPRDDRERDILKKYQRVVALVFNVHMGFAQFNNFTFAAAPVASMLAGNPDVFLPFKTYEIYDRSDSTYYWVTYVFQVMANDIGIFVNISFDTILAGFLLLTCGQIDLCCHRFLMANGREIKKSVKECVVHQMLIRRIVRKLESFFMCVVVPLMFLSLITFCTSIYNVSQTNTSGAETVTFFTYLVCLLCQLCCYCWFGNELKLKSTAIRDAIYNSDWTVLKPVDRKSLYFIMLSCQREMTISFHGLCTLTIEIFVWVLKTSYAACNLLKTVDSNDNP